MIFVAVGTFIHGFDELVAGADAACGTLGVPGFAQIGHSRQIPSHLEWERFLAPSALRERLAAAQIVICHGGIGLLGEAMRGRKPVIALPRRGRPSSAHPAGDQTGLVHRLAGLHPLQVCADPGELTTLLRAGLARGLKEQDYHLHSDVPQLLIRFLALGGMVPGGRAHRAHARSRS